MGILFSRKFPIDSSCVKKSEKKYLTKGHFDCIYGIYTVMTREFLKPFRGYLRRMDSPEAREKEIKMQRPKGQATTRVLIFIIVLILIVLFFLG